MSMPESRRPESGNIVEVNISNSARFDWTTVEGTEFRGEFRRPESGSGWRDEADIHDQIATVFAEVEERKAQPLELATIDELSTDRTRAVESVHHPD